MKPEQFKNCFNLRFDSMCQGWELNHPWYLNSEQNEEDSICVLHMSSFVDDDNSSINHVGILERDLLRISQYGGCFVNTKGDADLRMLSAEEISVINRIGKAYGENLWLISFQLTGDKNLHLWEVKEWEEKI